MEHTIKANHTETPSIHKIGFLYGSITAIMMIVYFIIMWLLNLIEYAGFRYVNYLFIGLGIFLAYRSTLGKIHRLHLPYLQGLLMGLWTYGFAAIVFGIFVGIFAAANSGFLPAIAPKIPIDGPLTPFMAGFLVFAESFIIGVVWTLILMQYFKREDEQEA